MNDRLKWEKAVAKTHVPRGREKMVDYSAIGLKVGLENYAQLRA